MIRQKDNRNFDDVEEYLRARIEVLQAAVIQLQKELEDRDRMIDDLAREWTGARCAL